MRRCMDCMREYAEEYGDHCPFCGYKDGTEQAESFFLKAGSILRGRYIVGTAISHEDPLIRYIGWDAMFERKVDILEYFPEEKAVRDADDYGVREQSPQDEDGGLSGGVERFYKSSREMIRLYKDPDAVTYHAVFKENNTCYAVTEYTGRELSGGGYGDGMTAGTHGTGE